MQIREISLNKANPPSTIPQFAGFHWWFQTCGGFNTCQYRWDPDWGMNTTHTHTVSTSYVDAQQAYQASNSHMIVMIWTSGGLCVWLHLLIVFFFTVFLYTATSLGKMTNEGSLGLNIAMEHHK